MQDPDRTVTVFAPNTMGAEFVRSLLGAGIPVTAITNSAKAAAQMEKLRVTSLWRVNTSRSETENLPKTKIRCIYLFETSFALTCRLLQLCRPYTIDRIVVVTKQNNPRSIYRLLGADLVLYTHSEQVAFLLTDLISEGTERAVSMTTHY